VKLPADFRDPGRRGTVPHGPGALVPPGGLRELLGHAGAIERMAATISSLVAARRAEGAVDRDGDKAGPAGRAGSARAAALPLARARGSSLGEARRAIEAGQAMGAQPEVSARGRPRTTARWVVVVSEGSGLRGAPYPYWTRGGSCAWTPGPAQDWPIYVLRG
jgi:hypothetical protein